MYATWYNTFMYHQPLNKKVVIKRIVIYAGMTLAVGAIVASIIFFILGYRFDSNEGRIEQYAMLQFNSNPSGASIKIDDKFLSIQTPNKITIPAGSHSVAMSKAGYETWNKNINIKSGVLVWLNYALLVPKILTVEPTVNFTEIYQTLASPEGHYMLVQGRADTPAFELVDISANTIKTSSLTLPATLYTDANAIGVSHTFQIDKWDDGGRYALIKHSFGDKNEWLVLDTQDVNLSKNITRLFDFAISSIKFSGTSGNVFYALGGSDIRKIDLSAGTISRPLVGSVISFETYNSNIICYVGNGTSGANQKVVGLYRDGDDNPYIIQTITKSDNLPINASVVSYFSQYYVAISDGKKVDILSGSYPVLINDTSSIKALVSLTLDENIQNLSFSPIGQYILMQSGAYFASYDLEYQSLASSTVKGTEVISGVKWLNDNYIWADRDGSLSIFEFDGANTHVINPVVTGQSVTLTSNGRYIYSIDKTATGYQLQRVRMILP